MSWRRTQPWRSFAENVKAMRESVIPTRMVSHGVTGRAFEDMAYALEGVAEDKGRYSHVRRQGKVSNQGNVVMDKSGSVRIVGGMAFLRLWLDADVRNGKSSGKYYAEPVYYADIPLIRNGTYTPRSVEVHVARTAWRAVPPSALKSKPIVLFRGDVLCVDGRLARFWSIDIYSRRMQMRDLRTGEPVKDFPSIASWRADTAVSVLQEDCLGHCYLGLEG